MHAGADLVLLTGRGSYTPVYTHLLAAARSSPAFRARVRDAAARVLALRAASGAEATPLYCACVSQATPNIGLTCNLEVVGLRRPSGRSRPRWCR